MTNSLTMISGWYRQRADQHSDDVSAVEPSAVAQHRQVPINKFETTGTSDQTVIGQSDNINKLSDGVSVTCIA